VTPPTARVRDVGLRIWRDVRRAAITSLPHRTAGAVQAPRSLSATVNEIHGWAFHDQADLVAVMVSIGGTVVATADLTATPSDLVAARPETRDRSRCGWRASIDLRGFDDQHVRLGGLAVFSSGLVRELSPQDVIVGPLQIGEITGPLPGSIVQPGPVHVTGWADPRLGLARVEVKVNGTNAGPARPAIPVPGGQPLPGGSLTEAIDLRGFEHEVIGTGRSMRIEAEIVDRTGCRFSIPGPEVTLEARASTPPGSRERLDALATRVRSVRPERRREGPSIRLVAFTYRLDVGGGQLYLTELLRQLLASSDISCLVISASDGPLRSELEAQGASIHVTDFPFASPDSYEARVFELAHLVAANDCNVSIVNTAVAGIGADLAVRLGVPGIWAIHESVAPDEGWLMPYYVSEVSPHVSACLRRALAESAAVVFEAEATRQLYLPSAREPERFLLVPYGVPIDKIDEYQRTTDRADVRAAKGIAPDATVLLCVGTFEPRKAQAALVMAFAQVADAFPEALLVLVGASRTPYSNAVRGLVAELGLQSRIRLEPVVDDVYAWYLSADVFVLGSDVESMPRTLLEAMAFERPVLSTSAFGIAELIEDGRTGLLVEPRDLSALESGLDRVLSMPIAERTALGQAAGNEVRIRHDSANYASTYRKLLRGLVADAAALPADLLVDPASST
jgi:D-inositol-3-phosphate glycosyltransferase